MRRQASAILLVFWPALLHGAPPADALAAGESPDSLAAGCLRQAANDLVFGRPDQRSRAGRIAAFAAMAYRLSPDDPASLRLLADVLETQGDYARSADILEKLLAQNSRDHALGLHWIKQSLAARETAEKRLEFLQSAANRPDLSDPLRAEAAAGIGRIRVGQGLFDEARKAYDEALRLDGLCPSALAGRLAADEKPSAVLKATVLIGLVRGNPLAVGAAWDLAVLLGNLGLHDASLEIFDFVWQMSAKDAAALPPGQMAVQYLNALLDAGKAAHAAGIFEPIAGKFKDDEVRLLLFEALRDAGKTQQAQDALTNLQAECKQTMAMTGDSPASCGRLAWLYLIAGTNAPDALIYARKCSDANPDDQSGQVLLGAAELAALDKQGAKRLAPLAAKDPYAAAFLAADHLAKGSRDEAGKLIRTGADLARRGRAWRMLNALAGRAGAAIQPAQQAQQVAELIKSAPRDFVKMGLNPEKYVSITIQPSAREIQPGQAVELRAELANIGDCDVPVGQWGLVNPAAAISVSVAGRDKAFTQLPVLVLPAPRYLKSGAKIASVVRLDAAELGDFLQRRPLEKIELKISAVPDPVRTGQQTQSAMPAITVKPAAVARLNMLSLPENPTADNYRQAWQNCLGYIAGDLKSGQVSRRMWAARQIACLLAMLDAVPKDRPAIPEPLRDVISSKMILRLMLEATKDKSCAIRAQTVLALGCVHVDDDILGVLAGLVNDPDPAVRLAMADLLGRYGTAGQQKVLDQLAADSDPLVARLAKVFAKQSDETSNP
ncbi:MAG: HEAT repeat domain-containing protein [Planctomycetes bacterium]|nr:HEAT repeat domain-containing protein [Planctomycetota bacterium]